MIVPGNPNRKFRETHIVVYTIYLEAICGYMRFKNSSENDTEVSAVDVFHLVCERATNNPVLLVILIYL